MKYVIIACALFFFYALMVSTQNQLCRKADVIFVIDASGSVKYANWLLALKFVQSLVSNLSSQISDMRYGFIRFENTAEEMFSLDSYSDTASILNAINKIEYPYDRETNISGAIWKMRDMFAKKARPGVTKVGIMVSDGESKIDGQYVAQYAREARSDRITIIVIAVTGLWLQMEELKLIASEHRNKQLLYNITYYSELNTQLEEIVMETCEVSKETNPKSICEEDKDLLFLVDISVINSDDLLKIKKFINDVPLTFNANLTRFGVVTFSDSIQSSVPLKFYYDKKEFFNLVNSISLRYSQMSDLAGALKMAGSILDSDYRQRVIIIITNRGSSDDKAAIANAVLLRTNLYSLIKILVVGNWINKHELFEVASYPTNQSIFFLNTFNELDSYVSSIEQSTCNGKLLCKGDVCQNNGFCSYDYLTYYCGCASGYGSFNCKSKCQSGDVIIGIDTTNVFSASFFSEHILKFIRMLMHHGQGVTNSIRMMVQEISWERTSPLIDFDIGNAWDSIQLLKFINFGGKRNISQVLSSGISLFQKYGNKQSNKFFLIISFGKSENLFDDFKNSAKVRQMGIHVLFATLQISENTEMINEMKLISSNLNGENAFVATKYNEILSNVIESLCNSKNECQPNSCYEGSTCIDKINGFECFCSINQSGELCDKTCPVKYDIVFMIDKSNNMRPERFLASLEFIKMILIHLNIGDNGCRIALVTFADDAKVDFDFSSYNTREDVIKALHFPQYTYGKANIANALRTIKDKVLLNERGDRPSAPNWIFAMSTGSDTDSSLTLNQATDLKNAGTHLLAVKIGEGEIPLELTNLVSFPPKEHIFLSTSFRSLNSQLAENIIKGVICTEPDPCLNNKCEIGSTCVSYGHFYECICLPDRTGPYCNKSCSGKSDVVLALDLSGSLADSFDDIILFCRALVNNLIFYPDRNKGFKLAILTYSDYSNLIFNFDRYNAKSDILNAINFAHINGKTNTASVLKMSLEAILTSSANRQDAPDHVIIVTDGNSNVNVPDTISDANKLKSYGAKLTVVAVEDFEGINMEEINSLASNPVDTNRYIMHLFNRENEINYIANNITSILCAS